MDRLSPRRTIIAVGVATTIGALAAKPRHVQARNDDRETSPEAATGVTLEPIAGAAPLNLPDHILSVYRFTLPPGEVVAPDRHPGTSILTIEAGQLGYTLLRGTVTIQQSDRPVETAVGKEVILGPGATVVYDRETAHSARNPGSVPVVVLAVTLRDAAQPSTVPTDDHGMPLS